MKREKEVELRGVYEIDDGIWRLIGYDGGGWREERIPDALSVWGLGNWVLISDLGV